MAATEFISYKIKRIIIHDKADEIICNCLQRKTKKMTDNFFQIEVEIVERLKTIYDPEIPVNIYELGLIYNIDVNDDGKTEITMTLTSPNCPMADQILEEVKMKIQDLHGVSEFKLKLVFEPTWTRDMMSEEAKLELGFL